MKDTRLLDLINNNENNYMLPFYWQHGTHTDRIPEQVERIFDSGCRALCVESRPHKDFGGEGWWRDMDVILEECAKRDMKVWILDDRHFPTGYANGLIAQKYPHLRQWTVIERHVDVMGPAPDTAFLMTPSTNEEPLVSIIAYPRTKKGEEMISAPVDLTDKARDGYLYWNVPEGCWRIFFLYRSQRFGKVDYMDMISEESCHALIEAVYEPHYEHYASYFGNTIAGFFSDEPCFGNNVASARPIDYGMYERRVGDPGLAYPYNSDVLTLMTEEMGEDARLYLGELWYDSDHAPKTRLAYMNAITYLWRKCFSKQIGNWCHERGVMYIGHVVEDMNAHGRLYCSGGHYFRALEGQDMSGMDIVLHQVMPGMAHYMHNSICAGGVADSEFFHYVLGQMTASMAHQYPQMKGRAMCEEFGAYGWAEGSTTMKWLSDFLLVRGINHFVPHAFSPDYPDADCPPHFGAEGHDPQFAGFSHLMRYTNKVSHILYGGEHVTSCAILYHAEGEWMNPRGQAMVIQTPAKKLLDGHLCYDILCLDRLENAEIKNGKIVVNGESYGALVVPYAPLLPDSLIEKLKELDKNGVPVLLCNDRPNGAVGEVVQIDALASRVRELGLADITVSGDYPLLRHYHVRRDDADVLMLFNEDSVNTVKTTVKLSVSGSFARLRLIEDCAFADTTDNGEISVELLPGQSEILVFGASVKEANYPQKISEAVGVTDLTPTYEIFLADSDDMTAFAHYKTTDKLVNIASPDEKPEFSGVMRYTFTLHVDEVPDCAVLDLGRVGQTAELYVNGSLAGIRITLPYSFPISSLLKKGDNTVTVDVANTLVAKARDRFSFHMPIAPSGLLGPIRLLEYEQK